MILTPDQRLAMEASFNTQQNSTNVKRAVTRISSELWPNGRVPYVIDTSLGKQSAVRIWRRAQQPFQCNNCMLYTSPGPRARASIGRAIQQYRQNSCVRFVPRVSEANYVEFFRGTG